MLRFLESHQSPRTRRYRRLLAQQIVDNVFNPSFLELRGRLYIAFRHFGMDRRPPFRASLVVAAVEAADSDDVVERYDLSDHVRDHGVENMADPKLVRLGDEAWVTFNDGWSAERNRLFLMQLTPALGPPCECLFEGRARVEKNWSFFVEDGRLKALYSLDGLRILEAPLPQPDGMALRFQDARDYRPEEPGQAHGLSIGTQAVLSGDNLLLVAHEKWHFGGRRVYMGRWVAISRGGPKPTLRLSARRLVHSAGSLLGHRIKHNRNLLSCTYFSGLDIRGEHVVLGYGVNDVDYQFAELPIGML